MMLQLGPGRLDSHMCLGGHNSLCSRDGRGRGAGISSRRWLDESQGLIGRCVLRSQGGNPMKVSPVTLGIVVEGLWRGDYVHLH